MAWLRQHHRYGRRVRTPPPPSSPTHQPHNDGEGGGTVQGDDGSSLQSSQTVIVGEALEELKFCYSGFVWLKSIIRACLYFHLSSHMSAEYIDIINAHIPTSLRPIMVFLQEAQRAIRYLL